MLLPCQELSPYHGHAEMIEEFDHKNISHEGGGTMAVGVDVSRHLPGLYWLNFFGQAYRDLIGREKLLSAPAYEVREVDDGVMLALHSDPRAWTTDEFGSRERAILEHLGPEYFFNKDDLSKPTIAPHFNLPQKLS